MSHNSGVQDLVDGRTVTLDAKLEGQETSDLVRVEGVRVLTHGRASTHPTGNLAKTLEDDLDVEALSPALEVPVVEDPLLVVAPVGELVTRDLEGLGVADVGDITQLPEGVAAHVGVIDQVVGVPVLEVQPSPEEGEHGLPTHGLPLLPSETREHTLRCEVGVDPGVVIIVQVGADNLVAGQRAGGHPVGVLAIQYPLEEVGAGQWSRTC